jgi:hypothetical protein
MQYAYMVLNIYGYLSACATILTVCASTIQGNQLGQFWNAVFMITVYQPKLRNKAGPYFAN